MTGLSVGQQRGEVLHRGTEVALTGTDREVDRIEVGFAVETTSQVGSWIDGRFGFLATGTEEHEPSIAGFAGPAEVLDQLGDRNVVA